jgi:hypothetical protein
MTLFELLEDPPPPVVAIEGRYWLQGLRSRHSVAEGFANLNSAVTRASELIRAGYVTEICSTTFPESRGLSSTNLR